MIFWLAFSSWGGCLETTWWFLFISLPLEELELEVLSSRVLEMLDCSKVDAKLFDEDDSFDLKGSDVFFDSNLDVPVVSFDKVEVEGFLLDRELLEFCLSRKSCVEHLSSFDALEEDGWVFIWLFEEIDLLLVSFWLKSFFSFLIMDSSVWLTFSEYIWFVLFWNGSLLCAFSFWLILSITDAVAHDSIFFVDEFAVFIAEAPNDFSEEEVFSDVWELLEEWEAEDEEVLEGRFKDAGGFNRRASGREVFLEEELWRECEVCPSLDIEESCWSGELDWVARSCRWSFSFWGPICFESEELSDFGLTCEPNKSEM